MNAQADMKMWDNEFEVGVALLCCSLGENINQEARPMVYYGSYEMLRIVGIMAYELASIHKCTSKVTSRFATEEET